MQLFFKVINIFVFVNCINHELIYLSIFQSPTPPQYVFWYHNDRMINYDATRGGITVETEPGARTQSRLTVRGATLKDSGNYTCSASNTEPASIHVFVSEGSKFLLIITITSFHPRLRSRTGTFF